MAEGQRLYDDEISRRRVDLVGNVRRTSSGAGAQPTGDGQSWRVGPTQRRIVAHSQRVPVDQRTWKRQGLEALDPTSRTLAQVARRTRIIIAGVTSALYL